MQYLEHRAIAEAKASNIFVLNENKQTPKAPNLPEYRKDDMEGFFEDVKFLTSFIGCSIFDVAKPKEEHLSYTKGRGCDLHICFLQCGKRTFWRLWRLVIVNVPKTFVCFLGNYYFCND